MQATVHSFDPGSSTGVVLRDDGALLPFTAEVFAASGLLHLRLGQRLSIALDPAESRRPPYSDGQSVSRLWIVGIGDGEAIN